MNTDSHDPTASLELRLRADARAARVAPPEGMVQRISAAIGREAAGRQAPPHRQRFPRYLPPLLAGLATCACALASLLLWRNRPEPTPASEREVHYLVDQVQTLPARLASIELQRTDPLPVTAPLAREFDSIRADARNALAFLAANFVPAPMRERASPAPSTDGSGGT